MATGTLTSTNPAATYKSLLKVQGTNQVLDSTLRVIEDGDGNDSSLKLTLTGSTYGASFAGKVGIGVDDPDQPLEIACNDTTDITAANISNNSASGLHISNTNTAANDGAFIKFSTGTTESAIAHIEQSSGYPDLVFYTDNSGGTLTEAMRIDDSQNVGIGCDPSVANSTNSLVDLKYNGYLLWQTHGSDADERAWGFKNSYATKGTFGLASSNADDNVLDTSVMSWSKEGNVGIGVADPDQPLEIKFAQTVNVTNSTITDNTASGLHISNSESNANDGAFIKFSTGTTESAIAHIEQSSGYPDLVFYTDNSGGTLTEAMRIDDSQNVGIGCDPSVANSTNSLVDLKYNGYLLWQTHGSDADERAWGFKNSYATKGTFGLASSNADDNVLDTSVMSWSKEGNVGIGTTAFASGVKCLGLINGTAPGGACTNTAGLYTSGGDLFGFADDGNATALAAASSDERAKDNIAVIPNALSRLANVKGVTFNYVSFKDSTLPFKDKIPDSHEYTPYKNWGDDTRVGVIAQGVEVAYDGLNITNSVSEKSITEEDYDPELGKEQEVYGTSKQVDMETLIPLLIEAVKEL